jgi:hypothetical protein
VRAFPANPIAPLPRGAMLTPPPKCAVVPKCVPGGVGMPEWHGLKKARLAYESLVRLVILWAQPDMPQQQHISGDGSKYVGKRLLVGITHEDHEGVLIRQEQFHGVIVETSDRGVVIECDGTGERRSFPPQLMEAPPGNYRLRSTGEVVVDPDYLSKWIVVDPHAPGNGDPAT